MAAPTRPAPAAPMKKAHRGEGQWAMGHLEPLNPNERTKKDDDGLNVRRRIETIYAQRGFDSIDPADLRGRFRWWGLYTQRRPGIDGGRTGMLEPEELDDSYFMMRVRIDGGAPSSWACWARYPGSTPATPPTSPTGRTSSTTGSGSRTCPRSGNSWKLSGCPPPRLAATAHGWCWARRS